MNRERGRWERGREGKDGRQGRKNSKEGKKRRCSPETEHAGKEDDEDTHSSLLPSTSTRNTFSKWLRKKRERR